MLEILATLFIIGTFILVIGSAALFYLCYKNEKNIKKEHKEDKIKYSRLP